jgi:hypothetical protein
MFNQTQVDGGSCEQAACEDSDEFSNVAHFSILACLGAHILVLLWTVQGCRQGGGCHKLSSFCLPDCRSIRTSGIAAPIHQESLPFCETNQKKPLLLLGSEQTGLDRP